MSWPKKVPPWSGKSSKVRIMVYVLGGGSDERAPVSVIVPTSVSIVETVPVPAVVHVPVGVWYQRRTTPAPVRVVQSGRVQPRSDSRSLITCPLRVPVLSYVRTAPLMLVTYTNGAK